MGNRGNAAIASTPMGRAKDADLACHSRPSKQALGGARLSSNFIAGGQSEFCAERADMWASHRRTFKTGSLKLKR